MPQVRLPLERQTVMSAPADHPELATLRQALDEVDDALAGLLAHRVRLSRQAQACKARVNLPAYDANREAAIRDRYERHQAGASALARAILRFCRDH